MTKLPNCVPEERMLWGERMQKIEEEKRKHREIVLQERRGRHYDRLEKEGKPNLSEAEDH